jgi:hypothetical protein
MGTAFLLDALRAHSRYRRERRLQRALAEAFVQAHDLPKTRVAIADTVNVLMVELSEQAHARAAR